MMTLDPNKGVLHTVNRSCVYTNVLKMYSDQTILREFPMHVEFDGEMAIDQGGVTRDMYLAFWEECYPTMFDGSTLLVPMLCPQMDTSLLPVVGSIISHSYLVSGFFACKDRTSLSYGYLAWP